MSAARQRPYIVQNSAYSIPPRAQPLHSSAPPPRPGFATYNEHTTDTRYRHRKQKGNSKKEDYEEEEEDKVPSNYAGDENEERGNWGGHAEYILSVIGYCVGLGNVWRFPYLAYKNGGGAFLIPYWIVALFIGFPLFLLEVSVGQFSSSGPTTCWRFAPIFGGCGFASFFLIVLVSLYYNTIVSWALYYLFASFAAEVPWQFCGGEREWVTWTNELCNLNMSFVCEDSTVSQELNVSYVKYDNGTCYSHNVYNLSETKLVGVYNKTLAHANNIRGQLPAAQYFYNSLIGEFPDTDFTNLGGLRWQNALCLVLAWLIVFVCLINGIKSAGKVVYFTAVFPYIGLLTLLIRGVTLDGGIDGIIAYITPDFEKLATSQVWLDAAVQVFYSLGPGWGSLYALASYNKFHNNPVRDALIAVFADSGTSLLAGFTVFSYLGYFAKQQGVPLFEVAEAGPSLVFIIYPSALTFLPFSPAWSVLFFFTLLLIALDSSFNMVEAILTGVLDKYPFFRTQFKYKATLFFGICFSMCLASMPMAMNGGEYVVTYLVQWTAGWPILLIALVECVSISYVYGYRRFAKDVALMWPPFDGCLKYFFGTLLCVLTPLVVSVIIVTDWASTKNITDRGWEFPYSSFVFGVMIQSGVLVPLFGVAIWEFCRATGSPVERLRAICEPTYDWGPYLVKHRKLVDYVPGFIVNPKKWKADQEKGRDTAGGSLAPPPYGRAQSQDESVTKV